MHMYRYLALYSPKYTNLTEALVACIVSCRSFLLLQQWTCSKDEDHHREGRIIDLLQIYMNRGSRSELYIIARRVLFMKMFP